MRVFHTQSRSPIPCVTARFTGLFAGPPACAPRGARRESMPWGAIQPHVSVSSTVETGVPIWSLARLKGWTIVPM